MLLPYIDQAPLFNKIDMAVMPNHANNTSIWQTKVTAYVCPSAVRPAAATTTAWHNYPAAGSAHSYGLCGKHGSASTNGLFASRWGLIEVNDAKTAVVGNLDPQMTLHGVTDGTSNTIAFSEIASGLPGTLPPGTTMGASWYQPGFGSTEFSTVTLATPNSAAATYTTTPSNYGTVRSYHTGGVQAVMVDGSVRFVSDSISGLVWKAICTPQGSELVGEY
jgi:prepilin-type processing-associated H-X9-DG protein